MQLHALRRLIYNNAAKIDASQQTRTGCSVIKLMGAELAWDTIDKVMQSLGAMGRPRSCRCR